MLSIYRLRRIFGLDVLVPMLERKRADLNFPIPSGEIASKPHQIYVPFRGKFVRISSFMSAVFTHPNGCKQILNRGERYLDLPVGSYTVQLVNMRQQSTLLPPVQGISQDAWDVALELEIVWKVLYPARVIQSQGFLHILISTCRAVIMDFIRSVPHDRIVQVPGNPQTISEEEITSAIYTRLRNRKIFDGLAILDIILVNRYGDQRRTEVVQNAIVEAKAIETELTLNKCKTQLASQKLEQDLELINQHRVLELAQAQTERLVAEENDQKRLRMAEIDAEEAKLRRSVREQEIEFQQIENAQQLEFQEDMKALDVKGEVFKQFGRAVVDAVTVPGAALGLNGNSQADILKVMDTMIGSLNTNTRLLGNRAENPRSPDGLPNGHEGAQVSPPAEAKIAALSNGLVKEIVLACKEIQGLNYESWDELPSGQLRMKWLYCRHTIMIDCDHGNPVQPSAVTVLNDGMPPQFIDRNWEGAVGLVGVLQATIKVINATKPQAQIVTGSDPTWTRPAA